MTTRFCFGCFRLNPCALSVAFLLCVISGFGGARADDTSPQLAKARQAYRNAVDKATIGLLDAFDAAIKTATSDGNLDAVKAIRAEKDSFEVGGRLPASARMKSAGAAYQLAMKSAATSLERAFEQEIKELTKAGKLEQATAVQAELKEFHALTTTAALQPADVTTKEKLREYLTGTAWAWGDGTKLKANGYVENKGWDSRGLITRWEAVDRRTVLFWIEKGRNDNRYAILLFSDDLTEFRGYDFNGKDRIPVCKRKP